MINQFSSNLDYIMHHGTKGMKWGIRLYQNYDGTHTPLGRERDRARRKHTYKEVLYAKSEGPLSQDTISKLDEAIESKEKIVVSDTDIQVQDYLYDKEYKDVEVYGKKDEGIQYAANEKWKQNLVSETSEEEAMRLAATKTVEISDDLSPELEELLNANDNVKIDNILLDGESWESTARTKSSQGSKHSKSASSTADVTPIRQKQRSEGIAS